MLLTGAGLLIQSFAQALRVDTGLEADNVVTARIALTREHRASDEAANKIRERLFRRCGKLAPCDVGGAVPFDALPGRIADQRVHPGERHAARVQPQPGAFR